MFESMLMAPSDPILGLSTIFRNDIRKKKINLGIGVYINEHNEAPILESVKHAEDFLLKKEMNKNYLNIEGIHAFNNATQSLLFGQDESIISKERIRTVQAPGGTGALRIISECIAKHFNIYFGRKQRIWISDPTWVNHKNIFIASGLELHTYPYYNQYKHALDFEKFLDTLNCSVKATDIVLLHCCCHNPTGIDPTIEQWKILSENSEKNGWIPLFDLAYQGFDTDLKNDLQGLHIFCKHNSELIVCNSYSKNFGLYNERVGACTIIAQNNDHAERALSQLKSTIRANYSNPPAHGASIVSTILTNPILYSIWENELKCMREHIKNMRFLLIQNLNHNNQHNKPNFDFITNQKGMFAYMDLNSNQVTKLRKNSGIYLVDSGRINLAGLSKQNIQYVCESIRDLF
ncbi:aspartate aminotransferase [Candidatus Blochmanniella vafra str. BVAF]|uniref:Aminotransferase n=1 Tax=Blochmanniella vafra (strain BVAF) TaxID=859654 RepID=E8Q6B8_BLOVB|nr:amino acid aminotransferase [Candidatus Blochmannia vafer]ADV33812.1 aspartate aminotransferase [Candidatus Blochmannia vafer str. BVAF]